MQITGMADVRKLAQDRLSALPNLCSKKAATLATDTGQLIRDHDKETNAKERSALLLLLHIPQNALEQSLGESLTGRSPIEIVNEITRRVRVTGGDPGRLEDALRDYHGLIQFVHQQGGLARSRAQQGTATAMDMNAYLDFRRDKAHVKYGLISHDPSAAAMDPLQRPQKRSRDGSTSAANVLTKLKLLHDKWYFDLTVDNRVVPDARIEGHGHIKSSSPCPSLFIMRGLQRIAGDPHVPPAVSHVARACCVMAFASLRETQTHRFGILRVSSHDGRLTAYCKTKRKKKNSPTEYLILPLSGIIHDNSAWFEVGGRAFLGLPPGSDFLTRGFEGPKGRDANNPFKATRMLNAPMLPKQFDLSVANILHTLLGFSWRDAQLYTRHSWKHFLPVVINSVPHADRANAIVVCNELSRWSGSTLSDKPHLLSCLDDNKAQFIQSISLMPQTYSEDAQIRQLRQLAQHQLDRVARALVTAGPNLPRLGGFDLLDL